MCEKRTPTKDSPRQLGLQEKRLRLLAAAAATDRLVMENRTHGVDTEQRLCIDRSCLAWWLLQGWPGAHESTPGTNMSKMIGSNRRVRSNQTTPRTTSCSRRRRARTCTETSRRARCRRRARARRRGRAPLWNDTKNGCLDQAMRVQCSSSCFTHHQCLSQCIKKKKPTSIQPGKTFRLMFGIFPEFGGLLQDAGRFCRNFKSKSKTLVGNHFRRHGTTSNGKRIDCNISNYVPFVVPGLSMSSWSTTPSPTSPSYSSQHSVLVSAD